MRSPSRVAFSLLVTSVAWTGDNVAQERDEAGVLMEYNGPTACLRARVKSRNRLREVDEAKKLCRLWKIASDWKKSYRDQIKAELRADENLRMAQANRQTLAALADNSTERFIDSQAVGMFRLLDGNLWLRVHHLFEPKRSASGDNGVGGQVREAIVTVLRESAADCALLGSASNEKQAYNAISNRLNLVLRDDISTPWSPTDFCSTGVQTGATSTSPIDDELEYAKHIAILMKAWEARCEHVPADDRCEPKFSEKDYDAKFFEENIDRTIETITSTEKHPNRIQTLRDTILGRVNLDSQRLLDNLVNSGAQVPANDTLQLLVEARNRLMIRVKYAERTGLAEDRIGLLRFDNNSLTEIGAIKGDAVKSAITCVESVVVSKVRRNFLILQLRSFQKRNDKRSVAATEAMLAMVAADSEITRCLPTAVAPGGSGTPSSAPTLPGVPPTAQTAAVPSPVGPTAAP